LTPGSFTDVQKQKLGLYPGTQVTESENHPDWFNNREQGDVGGDFFTQKKHAVLLGTPGHSAVENFNVGSGIFESYYYDGPVWPINPSDYALGFPDASAASNSELDKLGATAVARVAPTNAVISLTTFLGEILREGIPRPKFKLWEDRTKPVYEAWQAKRLGRHTGDDYLNLKFGWEPIFRDMNSVAQQINQAERIITQYERDAGKMVRRQYRFPEERSIARGSFSSVTCPFYGPRQSRLERSGQTHVIDYEIEIVKRRWFSGAFTYHLPSDWVSRKNMRGARDMLSNLFDTSITPEAIWNLTPWSWAIDWFANTGDVLHNVSAFAGDALVMRYGYMMQHTVATTTYTSRDPFVFKDEGVRTGVVKFVVETKQRRRANPYGFGISWDSLSLAQKAILGALGLSKGLR